jgi:endonuclease YncB( thermonuclease family)
MTNNLYTYEATVIRTVDGDTAELAIDLGFTISWTSTCRFYGINTPELKSKDKLEREKAKEAKTQTESYLQAGSRIKVISRELDKYGRPLVDIYCGTDYSLHLNQWLVDNGYAKTYLF